MSDQNDMFPPDGFGAVPYASATPYGSAPTLVRLAAVFNLIMAALDILYGLFMAVVGAVLLSGALGENPFEDPSGNGPPPALLGGVMFGVTALAIIAGIVKLVAGMKLLRKRPGAFGWGLTGGILGCVQLWCSYFCVLPMAIGIFTIVVMSLENVRRYLRDVAASQGPPAETVGP